MHDHTKPYGPVPSFLCCWPCGPHLFLYSCQCALIIFHLLLMLSNCWPLCTMLLYSIRSSRSLSNAIFLFTYPSISSPGFSISFSSFYFSTCIQAAPNNGLLSYLVFSPLHRMFSSLRSGSLAGSKLRLWYDLVWRQWRKNPYVGMERLLLTLFCNTFYHKEHSSHCFNRKGYKGGKCFISSLGLRWAAWVCLHCNTMDPELKRSLNTQLISWAFTNAFRSSPATIERESPPLLHYPASNLNVYAAFLPCVLCRYIFCIHPLQTQWILFLRDKNYQMIPRHWHQDYAKTSVQ